MIFPEMSGLRATISRIFFVMTPRNGQAPGFVLASAIAIKALPALRSRDLSRTEIPV
jgi:hypothetical protein